MSQKLRNALFLLGLGVSLVGCAHSAADKTPLQSLSGCTGCEAYFIGGPTPAPSYGTAGNEAEPSTARSGTGLFNLKGNEAGRIFK